MTINWISYYDDRDGYGRFSSRCVAALKRNGLGVVAMGRDQVNAPEWMHAMWDLNWDRLTISCMAPFYLVPVPGRHWLFSMTEGSRIADDWLEKIQLSGVERVLVPCEHNARAFADSGVTVPISVVPGGTNPHEFPLIDWSQRPERPYTFLTLADRGQRKGWMEVWDAFYTTFGGKTTGVQDVRLIVKARAVMGSLAEDILTRGVDLDPRVTWLVEDTPDMRTLYEQADCLVLPSRSEGWGMPHREAAMMGVPVITQAYSGLADAGNWALVVEGGRPAVIPEEEGTCLGEWLIPDINELANMMQTCYAWPTMAQGMGSRGATWLRDHQTWDHAAKRLIKLIENPLDEEAPAGATAELNYTCSSERIQVTDYVL